MQDYKNYYANGLCFLKDGNLISARNCFLQSMDDPDLRGEALRKVIQINIKEGKFAEARSQLLENYDNNNVNLKMIFGLLESIENNFEASKNYYLECLNDPTMQKMALFDLAKIHIKTEEFEMARKMFETLLINEGYKIKAIFNLAFLDMLEENYKGALKRLDEIDASNLSPTLYRHYRQMNVFINYFLDNLDLLYNDLELANSYTVNRLLSTDDSVLLGHLEKHLSKSALRDVGFFFKYTDLKAVLKNVKNIIQDLNPNHSEGTDAYRFRIDSAIGYCGDEVTRDLCVITSAGTKEILTLYPISLSDQFDKEGFSSKDLGLSRNKVGNRL